MTDNGHCVMRGSCGTKGWFGKSLPCPDDGPPDDPSEDTRSLLTSICGASFAKGPVCCTSAQLEELQQNLNLAETMISSCPACRNNFRNFFCQFTCSSHQSTFLNITSTQESSSGELAVASIDFWVEGIFSSGFYDSCKNVQFGATNSYAMDLIGGGAKTPAAFLKFLGTEKPEGSPFQIDFPAASVTPPGPDLEPLSITPRNCSDNDIASRCTCVDCPVICQALPPVPDLAAGPTCEVGMMSCFTFILTLAYSITAFVIVVGYLIRHIIHHYQERRYDHLALAGGDTASTDDTPLSPRAHPRRLVGASSISPYTDGGDDTNLGFPDGRHLGRGTALLDPVETVQPRQNRLNNLLRRWFYKLGLWTASSPWLTFAIVFTLIGLLNIGWKYFAIETDPVKLWVRPGSSSKLQKEFFDEHFGPFYRTEQVFLSATDPSSSVVTWDNLQYIASLDASIRQLQSTPSGYTLSDVCFKPAGSSGACVAQSVIAWFGGDDPDEQTWSKHLVDCAESPVNCLPDFQQPLGPEFVLGGIPMEATDDSQRYLDSKAFVMTYVVSASLDPAVEARAMEWERTVREFLSNAVREALDERGLMLSFSTGVSLEEEINKSSNTDVKIVVLSYLAMFFYIAFTLGNAANVSGGRDDDTIFGCLRRWAVNLPKLFRSHSVLSSSSLSIDSRDEPTWLPHLPRRLFIGSKFTLGLFGIGLVILSVSSSVGLFSLVGVKVTLIIAEVIPFLVLAVGVDNVFILVHELDRQNLLHGPNAVMQPQSNVVPGGPGSSTLSPGGVIDLRANVSPADPSPSRPGNVSSRSQLTSHDESLDAHSLPIQLPAEERVARALAKMGPSILLSTVTETVAFALGALVPMPAVRNFALYAAGSVLLNAVLQVTVFVSALTVDLRRVESNRLDCFPCVRLSTRIRLHNPATSTAGLGKIARFIRKFYASFILQPVVKGIVLLIFGGILVASIISIQHIELGLDQRLALPSDSYLVPYFDSLDAYFEMGPPVYFVSHDLNVTDRKAQQQLCGRFTTCNPLSIPNVLEQERHRTDVSFIAEPTASWIDDFLRWLDPATDCCRVRKRNPEQFCGERDRESLCRPCFEDREPAWNITMSGLPQGEEFMYYLRQWIISPTNERCPLAGAASFGSALSLGPDNSGVSASHFRTFHSPLKSQSDYINSLTSAHRIADEISSWTGTSVFPYSLHYVFFDQYTTIIAITQEILGLGLAAVLIITALMLGSWRTGAIITGVVALTVVSVMGVMGVWGIMLNAISLVNLVISLGIAVEFCAHMARAFMGAGTGIVPIDYPSEQKERDDRMWTALVDVGPSVLSGITFTKLIGMSVLALTRSRLLEIYYFRMWLTLIISGALHGLVLLPVVLSLAGGPGYALEDADEEWMSNAVRRHDYEYTHFVDADDDSMASG